MFGFLEDSVDNALQVVGSLLDGEAPSRRQVAKLIADGLSAYAISEITGYAVETIEKMMED